MDPNPQPPAVSPTGTPVIPPAAVKYIVPIVTLTGAVALAPVMGVDVSFLPPLALKLCAFTSFLGLCFGIAGPGVRK